MGNVLNIGIIENFGIVNTYLFYTIKNIKNNPKKIENISENTALNTNVKPRIYTSVRPVYCDDKYPEKIESFYKKI